MSSDKFTKFAVAGAGEIGLPLIRALASATPRPQTILVLSRDPSKLPSLPQGVTIATVDYSKPEDISAIVKEHGIEIFFSMITTAQVQLQYNLVDALKKSSGIKIFVPSEYGFPTEGASHHVFGQKFEFIKHLRSIELPYIRFYVGSFYSWVPKLTGYEVNKKVNVVGKGDAPLSWTSLEDISGFAAYVATNLPYSKLSNATFRLEGQAASVLDVARIYNLPIEYVDAVPGPLGDFATMEQQMALKHQTNVRWDWNKGRLLTEEEIGEEDARKVWVGHVWKRLEDVPLQA